MGQERTMVVDSLHKERYYVLVSDMKTRDGLYQKLGCNDSVYQEGYYKNGLKDSLWTAWYERGYYQEDRKGGIWEYYNFKGETEQEYDHSDHRIVYWKKYSHYDSLYNLFDCVGVAGHDFNRPPLYIGGTYQLMIQTVPNIHLSKFTKLKVWLKKRGQKEIVIGFIVDSVGKTSGHRVIKGITGSADKAVLEAIINLPDDWIPAEKNGRAVTADFFIPFNFVYHRNKRNKVQ